MATRLFALPLLSQNLQSGEGNSTGHSGGGEASLKLRNFCAFFEAFGLYLSFDAAMKGNEQRCGKKSPTMAIEGDEAKCSHSYLDFNTSCDNGE